MLTVAARKGIHTISYLSVAGHHKGSRENSFPMSQNVLFSSGTASYYIKAHFNIILIYISIDLRIQFSFFYVIATVSLKHLHRDYLT